MFSEVPPEPIKEYWLTYACLGGCKDAIGHPRIYTTKGKEPKQETCSICGTPMQLACFGPITQP